MFDKTPSASKLVSILQHPITNTKVFSYHQLMTLVSIHSLMRNSEIDNFVTGLPQNSVECIFTHVSSYLLGSIEALDKEEFNIDGFKLGNLIIESLLSISQFSSIILGFDEDRIKLIYEFIFYDLQQLADCCCIDNEINDDQISNFLTSFGLVNNPDSAFILC